MAFLDFVKASGNIYVYVAEYVGKQEETNSKEKRIFSLGRKEKALEKLEKWKKDRKKIPEVVKIKDESELDNWINKVVKRGAY